MEMGQLAGKKGFLVVMPWVVVVEGFLLLLLALLLLGSVCSAAPPSSPPPPWSGPHIADLNILLPPRMTNPVYYRLLGSGGCFTWSWDHHDFLSVLPEYNGTSGCSTSARLSSIASYSSRKETAVYATDIHSGVVIRCEVFIEKIARIQIFHHSVKLDLGGLATLHIRAFDDNENVFSSLVGLQFEWNLMSKSIEGDAVLHHLVHVPLKETPLSDCGGFCGDLDTRIQLEDGGVGSDLYVVKGVEIGHEIVTAHFLEPQAEQLMDEIILTVAELMSLDPPSPVFVIIGAMIQYRLRVIRQNTPKAIDLPSPHHRWSIGNSTVAKVDLMAGTVSALNLGITSVVVEDIRVAGHKQISAIHVVVPDKLSLYIIPVTASFDPLGESEDYPSSYTWYVVAGQQYVAHMKVFSPKPEENEIYLTENNDLKLEINNLTNWYTSLVSSDISSKYGWRNPISLKPHFEEHETLTASLTCLRGNSEIAEVLKVEQNVVVCNKVSIHLGTKSVYSEIILLPWAPGIYQEVEFMATGGCAKTSKDYMWFSSDNAIVSVSASGVVRANQPGQAVIKVASVFDSFNYAEVVVEVSIPSSMHMTPQFPVEAVVGRQLYAAVTLNSSNGNYQRCDAFSYFIRWKVFSGRECFQVTNTTDLPAFVMAQNIEGFESLCSSTCAWTYLYTFCPGHAMLQATFSSEIQSSDNFLDRWITLQASKRVAAYPPFVAKQAGSGNKFGGYWVDLVKAQAEFRDPSFENLRELYLTPGTAMDTLLLGGPERWEQGVEFVDTVNIYSEDNLSPVDEVVVSHLPTNGGKLYSVLCQTMGNYTLFFSRGNLVGNSHPLQTVENLELSLICSFPSSITLIANEHASTVDVIKSSIQDARGPGNIRLSPISVANGRTIRVAAVAIHDSGRPFANSSSLRLRWELIGCQDLAQWDDIANLERLLSTWEMFLSLKNTSGLCTVRATVTGFARTMARHLFEKASLVFESRVNGLTDALKLQLVSSLSIIPGSVLLVFNPEAKVNLSVSGGTCFLEALVNETQVVELIHPPGHEQCFWLMLASRGLGTALLTVYDKGLSPPAAATAMVKVADVDWIKLISLEEIFMLEGETRPFGILAGAQDGSTFDSSQYLYMNIHVHLEENVLILVTEDGLSISGDQRIYRPNFVVKAEHLGLSSIYVSVRGQFGNKVVSQRITVEVYPALRIHPHYIFLAPGASYMIAVEGGPTIGVVFEYGSLDDEIASIHRSSGRLSAISAGNTTVRVSSYENGGSLICEAYARVEVGIPPVMFLNMQSEQLCVGCQMPIFPSYPEGNLFSFYEVCKDYKWSIEDEKVLSFQSSRSSYSDVVAFQSSNDDSVDDDYGFINMLYGRSAGRTKVSVSFFCNFISSGSELSASYSTSQSLRVVSEPPLALGIPITWVLPPYYTTSNILPESSESYGQADSRYRKRSTTYSLLRSCERNSFTQEDPITIIGSRIKTKESNNIGCLQATDQGGRTDIACCVRVAEVAQVRLTTKEFPSHVAHLAINDKLDLMIGYCDDLGYPFFEAHGVVALDVETNYHDIVSIQTTLGSDTTNLSKGIAHLQAHSQGKALVKIFLKNNPQKAAYVLIFVGAQLFPRNSILRVGNFLNFSIACNGTTSPMGSRWLSTNESIISINKLTGEAHALAEGKVQVHFESSSMKLQTTVTVLKSEQIAVLAPVGILTNVDFPSKGYKFSVKLSDPFEYKFGATGTSSGVEYGCRVDPPYVGYAKPWMDHVKGVSYCLFFPYSPKHLLSSVSELNTTRAGLPASNGKGSTYISIIASLREAQHIIGSAHALFVGGFSVSEMERLNLTPDSKKIHFTIIGNTDVQIHWTARDLLLVELFHKDDFGLGAYAEYKVKALKARRFTDKITIVLPATGQTVELDVGCNLGEQIAPPPTSSAILAAVFMCFFMLLLTIVIFVRFLARPDASGASRQQGPPRSTTVGSPVTPGSSSTGGSQSPSRTPQPFMEYVRRTIDETPYYKRDRRRFDPQYTY